MYSHLFFILFILLLFKPTNAQYINSNVCTVKYSDIFSMYLCHLQGFSSYIIVNLLLLLILLMHYTFVGRNKKLYKMHRTYIKKVSSLFQ